MTKAIIFDADDTLIKFSNIAAPIFQKTASNLKLKVPKKEQINRLWGRSLEFMVNDFWSNEYFTKFKKEYIKLLSEYKFKEINGASKVISELSKNYSLGIISAKPRVNMIKHFKDAKIDTKIFKFMFSADDTKYHKPDPRVFNQSIRQLRLEKEEILYVGDTIIDCVAAKFAGLQFVAVLTGHYKRSEFIEVGLEKQNILSSIRDLPKWVEKNG